MDDHRQITLEELLSIMEEQICKKCSNGKSGWCGDCHFDELSETLNIKNPSSVLDT